MIENFKYTDKEKKSLVDSIIIIVDTREHEGKNDHIINYFDKAGVKWCKRKLDYCDYSFYIPKNEELGIPRDLYFDKKVAIERKANLEELSRNLTKERERLEKEFTLGPKTKCMIVENASYEDMVNGNYNTNYNNKSFWASYHSFSIKYDFPIFFIKDPKYTGFFIRGYFTYYLKNILR